MRKAIALLSLMSTVLLSGCYVVVPAKPIDHGSVAGTPVVASAAQVPQQVQPVAERSVAQSGLSGESSAATSATAPVTSAPVSGTPVVPVVPATVPQYAYMRRDLPSYLWEGAMMALRLCASTGRC